MKQGDVVLTPIQQADGKLKERPAIILREMPSYGDFLVCGISTQLHQHVKDFDEIISPADKDFKSSGLLKKSLIRLGFLAVLSRKRILGSIGEISIKRHKHLLKNLSDYLVSNSTKNKSRTFL
ncbi:MAG TPA: transcriptional regulator [Candidatus Cloacimonetes bacterium]|nr:transcriptional regulator [Candidatus Cloacimonadota bacterium]